MDQSPQNTFHAHDSAVKIKPQLVCLLCSQHIPLPEYERHIALHEQAEMLADILALSRR